MSNSPVQPASFVDCPLTKLENVPLPIGTTTYNKKIEDAAKAVGQLIVLSPGGAQIDRGNLTIPATQLRSRDFLHELHLRQETISDIGFFLKEYTINAPTATLIAEKKILTAYHAIIPEAVESGVVYFVWGRWHNDTEIAAPSTGRDRIRVPVNRYVRVSGYCGKKIGDNGPYSGNDWVILEIDNSIGIPPIPLDRQRGLNDGLNTEDLFLLSHPLGLPLKYARAKAIEKGTGGTSRILSDIGTGSSGAPLLLTDGNSITVVGLVNGGRLGFTNWHFVQTHGGAVIDPAPSGNLRPQNVTDVKTVIKYSDCVTEGIALLAPAPAPPLVVFYEIKFQDAIGSVWCGPTPNLILVQDDIVKAQDLNFKYEYVDEVIAYYSGSQGGAFTLTLALNGRQFQVSQPACVVIAGEDVNAATVETPQQQPGGWEVQFRVPASQAEVSTTVFEFGGGGPPSKLKVVVKKQEGQFVCPPP